MLDPIEPDASILCVVEPCLVPRFITMKLHYVCTFGRMLLQEPYVGLNATTTTMRFMLYVLAYVFELLHHYYVLYICDVYLNSSTTVCCSFQHDRMCGA